MNHNQIKTIGLDEEIISLISSQALTLKEISERITIKCAYTTLINHINKLREEKKIIKIVNKNYDLKHPIYKVIKNERNN